MRIITATIVSRSFNFLCGNQPRLPSVRDGRGRAIQTHASYRGGRKREELQTSFSPERQGKKTSVGNGF